MKFAKFSIFFWLFSHFKCLQSASPKYSITPSILFESWRRHILSARHLFIYYIRMKWFGIASHGLAQLPFSLRSAPIASQHKNIHRARRQFIFPIFADLFNLISTQHFLNCIEFGGMIACGRYSAPFLRTLFANDFQGPRLHSIQSSYDDGFLAVLIGCQKSHWFSEHQFQNVAR